jgi:hypothetical protein
VPDNLLVTLGKQPRSFDNAMRDGAGLALYGMKTVKRQEQEQTAG